MYSLCSFCMSCNDRGHGGDTGLGLLMTSTRSTMYKSGDLASFCADGRTVSVDFVGDSKFDQ